MAIGGLSQDPRGGDRAGGEDAMGMVPPVRLTSSTDYGSLPPARFPTLLASASTTADVWSKYGGLIFGDMIVLPRRCVLLLLPAAEVREMRTAGRQGW
ncbi:hypothetical protein E2562_008758 [Oryza meyeriana var. granulata]|uniref:Uncharacterized protein n=1 Tax=Oryza meyeriana var. granulata TaxID=110450 RepID=A0A6G1CZS6_9ORYZ|nr:hypothetical protein E2562_008758 [Oryza meyeriana var. granulata]